MIAKKIDPKRNLLLAALQPIEFTRLLPFLELVEMPVGYVIYESGQTLDHVYFPINAVIALLHVMKNGSVAESAVVGNEGLVGISLLMGGGSTPSRAVVQIMGYGFRLSAEVVKQEFDKGGPMLRLILRYAQALITQMAQSAVCNRHHSIDQQLSRFLLVNLDRLDHGEIAMTQESISNKLGVRREGITAAASKLQKMNILKYSRGKIIVLDRTALEHCSCECYALVKLEYDRLLPQAEIG